MDKEDHKTDIFIKKVVEEAGLESPSLDFTTTVLAKVNAKNQASTVTMYRPLISKSYLLALAVVLASIFVSFLMFGSTTTELEWIEIKVMEYVGPLSNALSSVTIAPTYLYAALGLLFFLYVQIYFLKRYADKHYSV